MKRKFLDIEDVARIKKVHPGTVYHWVERGLLKPVKPGRDLYFSRAQIQKWRQPRKGRKPKKEGGGKDDQERAVRRK